MNQQAALDASLEQVLYQVKRVIVGQDELLERMVVALLAWWALRARRVWGASCSAHWDLVRRSRSW